jgi:ATP adenylyltransferase
MEYILGEKPTECILCAKAVEGRDRENLVLLRGGTMYVLMNLYPYNTGHLMVAPYRHIATPEELADHEQAEMMQLTSRCLKAIRNSMNPAGFNIGMNVGAVAGAGVETHVHMHIVPRWQGDTSFMPVLADTKTMPEALVATYDRLKKALDNLP